MKEIADFVKQKNFPYFGNFSKGNISKSKTSKSTRDFARPENLQIL